MRAVTPGYFAAMGIPLLEGRGLAETDGRDTPAVAVIGESLARRFWPSASAVGHHLLYEWNGNERVEIIGVVGDVRHEGPAGAPLLEIYRPLTQFPHSAMTLVVRGSGDPMANAGPVRALMHELDRDLPIADLQAMDALVRDAVGPTRLIATLFTLFGGLGILLATIGIYGVMTYSVQQRRQEFGIRLALGGHAGTLVALTVRRGALLTMKGIAIGIAVAFLATRLMTRLLFGVLPSDRVTYGMTAALLSVVGIAAAYLPGRRAAQVNPVSLLRGE
jgi:predicted permease